MDPLAATGGIFYFDDENRLVHAGTCFAFRTPLSALTARHCLAEDRTYFVLFPGGGGFDNVLTIERHPTADIAVMWLEGSRQKVEELGGDSDAAFFADGVSDLSLGDDFMSYGFPSEGPAERAENGPIPRFFKGYFQRFYAVTQNDSNYEAVELSIPAPGGLSGAPLFRPGSRDMVMGLVTASATSFAVEERIDEVDEHGHRLRVETNRVITYGIGLLLGGVKDWLDEFAAKPSGDSALQQWTTKKPRIPDSIWRRQIALVPEATYPGGKS